MNSLRHLSVPQYFFGAFPGGVSSHFFQVQSYTWRWRYATKSEAGITDIITQPSSARRSTTTVEEVGTYCKVIRSEFAYLQTACCFHRVSQWANIPWKQWWWSCCASKKSGAGAGRCIDSIRSTTAFDDDKQFPVDLLTTFPIPAGDEHAVGEPQSQHASPATDSRDFRVGSKRCSVDFCV